MAVGEDFWLRIPMNNESAGRHLCMDDVEVIHAWLESGYGGCWTLQVETDGEQREGIAVKVPGSRLGLGTYAVVMAGKFVNGGHFRTKRQLFIRLVDREEQADAKPTMFNEEKAYWAGPAVLSEMLSRDGLNTYELAVLHGYGGTMEEFLAQAGIELQDYMVTKAKLSREVQTLLDKGAEKGITPKGEWSSAVIYNVNDLVYEPESNSAYVSLQSGNDDNHPTRSIDAELWWMKIVDGELIRVLEDEAQESINGANTAAATAERAAAGAVTALTNGLTGYFTCGASADKGGLQTKVVDNAHGYIKPSYGGAMKIRMYQANSYEPTAGNPVKLQIGSETAATLLYNGEAVSASNTWEEGEVISVYFDGTHYQATNVQGGGSSSQNTTISGSSTLNTSSLLSSKSFNVQRNHEYEIVINSNVDITSIIFVLSPNKTSPTSGGTPFFQLRNAPLATGDNTYHFIPKESSEVWVGTVLKGGADSAKLTVTLKDATLTSMADEHDSYNTVLSQNGFAGGALAEKLYLDTNGQIKSNTSNKYRTIYTPVKCGSVFYYYGVASNSSNFMRLGVCNGVPDTALGFVDGFLDAPYKVANGKYVYEGYWKAPKDGYMYFSYYSDGWDTRSVTLTENVSDLSGLTKGGPVFAAYDTSRWGFVNSGTVGIAGFSTGIYGSVKITLNILQSSGLEYTLASGTGSRNYTLSQLVRQGESASSGTIEFTTSSETVIFIKAERTDTEDDIAVTRDELFAGCEIKVEALGNPADTLNEKLVSQVDLGGFSNQTIVPDANNTYNANYSSQFDIQFSAMNTKLLYFPNVLVKGGKKMTLNITTTINVIQIPYVALGTSPINCIDTSDVIRAMQIVYDGVGGAAVEKDIILEHDTKRLAFVVANVSDGTLEHISQYITSVTLPVVDDFNDFNISSFVDYKTSAFRNYERILNQAVYTNNTTRSLRLLHFTDPHSDIQSFDDIVEVRNILNKYLDDILCTGDVVYAHWNSLTTTDTTVGNAATHGYKPWVESEAARQSLFVLGNHDCATKTTTEYDQEEGGTAWNGKGKDWGYETYFEPFAEGLGVVQPDGVNDPTSPNYHACYWHKDYTAQKVRLIGLDCMNHYDGLLDENNQPVAGSWVKHGTTEQEDWLRARLADTLDSTNDAYGFSVVICCHYPLNAFNGNLNEVWNETTHKFDYNHSENGGYLMNHKTQSPTVFNNFKVREGVVYSAEKRANLNNRVSNQSATYGYDKGDKNYIADIIKNFMDNDGKFVAWICGHTHIDSIVFCPEYPNILNVIADNTGYTKPHGEAVKSSYPEHANSNIYVIDTENGLFKIVRVGVNINRFFDEKNILCYDYVNRVILNEG